MRLKSSCTKSSATSVKNSFPGSAAAGGKGAEYKGGGAYGPAEQCLLPADNATPPSVLHGQHFTLPVVAGEVVFAEKAECITALSQLLQRAALAFELLNHAGEQPGNRRH